MMACIPDDSLECPLENPVAWFCVQNSVLTCPAAVSREELFAKDYELDLALEANWIMQSCADVKIPADVTPFAGPVLLRAGG